MTAPAQIIDEKAIRSDERERCAKIAEQHAGGLTNGGAINACRYIAHAIRGTLITNCYTRSPATARANPANPLIVAGSARKKHQHLRNSFLFARADFAKQIRYRVT